MQHSEDVTDDKMERDLKMVVKVCCISVMLATYISDMLTRKLGFRQHLCVVYIVHIQEVIPARYLDDKLIYHLQPSGRFVVGGPQVYAGMTNVH